MNNLHSKKWTDWTVAITGMNSRPDHPAPGYPVARCLQDSGLFNGKIIGLGYDILDAGLHHRDISDNGYLLPYPYKGADSLLERLNDIISEHPIDAIIPCLDSELLNFIAIEPQLKERGIQLLIPDRAMLLARNKDSLPELCAKIDIKTPACTRVTNPDFFNRCEKQGLKYPLVIKGIFCDAYVVHNPKEAKEQFHRMIHQWGYPALVQPFIAGSEYNLVAIGDGLGNMIGPVSMYKRALTDKGKAWAGISTLDDDLHAISKKLVHELQWKGPLEIEVLRNQKGETYLIEINPRFPAWVYLSHGVGRNLPIALLKLLADEKDFQFAPPKAGISFLRHAQDLIVDLTSMEHISLHGKSVFNDTTPIHEGTCYAP